MRRPSQSSKYNVSYETVRVEGSRRLITIGPDYSSYDPQMEGWKGAIVRIIPGLDWDEGLVESLKEELRSYGVEAIKVLPRPPKAAVIPQKELEPSQKRSSREVVMELYEKANSANPAELLKVLEAAMSGVGL